METAHNSPFYNLNFQLILFAALIFAAGCNFPRGNSGKQPSEVQAAAIDTMSVSPPDSINPEWNAKLDSMLHLAADAKPDTSLAKLYYDIGEMLFYNDSKKAKEYFIKLKDLSEKLNWSEGKYLFSVAYTDELNREGMPDSSIVIFQQTLELAKREMNEKWTAITLANLGVCYYYKKWFETALKYNNEALPLFEKRGEKFNVAQTYYMTATLYESLNMQKENLLYCEKALNIFNEKPDTLQRIFVLINYASALLNTNNSEKADSCLIEAQRICNLHNNKYLSGMIYKGLAEIAWKKYDLDRMEKFNRKSLAIDLEFEDEAGYCTSMIGLARMELCRGNFNQSEEYTQNVLKTAFEHDFPIQIKDAYTVLSDLSIARHDFRSYQYYLAKADSIEMSVVNEKTQRYAKEMEAKYETEKKELKIAALEKERGLMIWLSIAGGAVLLLTLATFFFLWRWTVQKRRLAETRIKQFEQEKQLVATQAVLDGETRERARLARDLHDGLGSMLTGAKLSLLEMKKGATLDYANMESFNNALGLLDESVQEMRRVAHHLMPDSLSRFGLKPAVSDFCGNLPSVHFNYYGNEARLDPKMEVMIYRSIHELVNNALKHAGAGKIMVQIIQEPDRIAFTVQDDGCGFDPATQTQGMGLQNIRTRIASYNGMIDINSKAGEGTEINVELRIENT